MQKYGLFLAAAVLAVTVFVVGCGGGDSALTGPNSTGDETSKLDRAGGDAITVTINGCAPRDDSGAHLDVVNVNEGDLVVWSNDNGGPVTLSFAAELFGAGELTLRDGRSVSVRVREGTAGNSYDYWIGCQSDAGGPARSTSGNPKVNVGGGGG